MPTCRYWVHNSYTINLQISTIRTSNISKARYFATFICNINGTNCTYWYRYDISIWCYNKVWSGHGEYVTFFIHNEIGQSWSR